jgi:hypothetical protein
MRRVRPLATTPLIVSILALLVALGGVSYAAAKLPDKSVGTAQLKKNAVIGAKVKDGSLTAKDFAAGQLSPGPTGPTGPTGAQGPAGPSILIAGEFAGDTSALYLKTVDFTVTQVTPAGTPTAGDPAAWTVVIPAATVPPGSIMCGVPTVSTVLQDMPSLYVANNICGATSAQIEIRTNSYVPGAYISFNYVIATRA